MHIERSRKGRLRPRIYTVDYRGGSEIGTRETEWTRMIPLSIHVAHPADNTSACSSTVRVAFSCLSGG